MTYSKKSLLALIIVFNFTSIRGYAQPGQVASLDNLAGQFIRNIREQPKEKILLQSDRSFYLAGETIWFRGFSLDAFSHKVSIQSKFLFVDLVDENDLPVTQVLLNIPQQQLEGSFTLPSTLKEGYYWLRGYTRKILEKDSASIAVIGIYVINPRRPDNNAIVLKQHALVGEPTIHFYPEGGSLISGTTSVIAFHAQDAEGNPIEISGYVTDSKDSIAATFKTKIPGFGRFVIDIWDSLQYIVHVRIAGQKELVYPLPLVDPYATQISVVKQDDKAFLVRLSLGDSLYKKGKLNSIIGISRDSLCFAATGKDMYELSIPKQDFPEGPATLIAFNDKNQVVSERNIFINRADEQLIIKPDKSSYGPREKTNVELKLTDHFHRSIKGLFAVSVTDDNMDKQKGLVNPSAYELALDFDIPRGIKLNSREDWDLFMVMQPSRFHGWKTKVEPANAEQIDFLSDTTIQIIRGEVLDEKERPVANQILTIFSTGKNILFIADTTDKQGRFHFRLPMDFPDSAQFTLQIANKIGTKLDKKILVDPFPFPSPTTPVQLKKRFDSTTEAGLRDLKLTLMDTLKFGKGKEWLKEVIVKAKVKKQFNYDARKRVSNFSRIVTQDQITYGVNNWESALLMVPGLSIRNGNIVALGGSVFSNQEPLLVMDGVPMDNSNGGVSVLGYLKGLSPSTIDFIEVLTGAEAAAFGLRGGAGVICINTNPMIKADDEYMKRGLQKIYTKGYLEPTAFTMPDYDNKQIRQSSYPDLRSTLYWNGGLLTDSKGNANISFFTSDPLTTYTVHVTGVTSLGDFVDQRTLIARK